MVDTFTHTMNPLDPQYKANRRHLIKELSTQSDSALKEQIDYLFSQPAPVDDTGVAQSMLHNIRTLDTPRRVKGFLDSGASPASSTGGVLIRQDLEPVLHILFVRNFPLWEAIAKGPSNGLVHAYNQITAPDSGALGSSLISEIGTVTYTASNFVRQTAPISVFAQGRGVTFKEQAAVRQGGVDYQPLSVELSNAMVRLSQDIQFYMFQGNFSNSSITSTALEGGAYNALAFDGLRGVLGSVGAFSANNATQVDIGSLNITESLQFLAAKSADKGGMPDMAVLGMNAKQALDTENQALQRWNDNFTTVAPGVNVSNITWANGKISILPVPGNTLGTYNRTSDNALVEDMYILDSSKVMMRWLYAENMTVLQIPSGTDGALNDRVIAFFMYGMEQAAPVFCGKARRLAS